MFQQILSVHLAADHYYFCARCNNRGLLGALVHPCRCEHFWHPACLDKQRATDATKAGGDEEAIRGCPRCEYKYILAPHKSPRSLQDIEQLQRHLYSVAASVAVLLSGYVLLGLDAAQSAIRCHNIGCLWGSAPYYGLLQENAELHPELHPHTIAYALIVIIFGYPAYAFILAGIVISVYMISSQARFNRTVRTMRTYIQTKSRNQHILELIQANPVCDAEEEATPGVA